MMINATILGVIVRVMTPVLLCANGAIYSERSGASNITLEGAMLFGAFTGVVGSYYTSNAVAALLCAILGGVLINALFGFLHLNLGGDNVVTGFAINTLCLGLTTFLLRSVFHTSGTLMDDRIVGFQTYTIPLLSDIPVLGHLFTRQTLIVYASWILIFATQVILHRTQFGMNLRACGENPSAAATVGVNVIKTRWICVVLTGVLTGLAGAQLSLGYLTMFSENMTAGRGFIAMAAVILSKARPIGVFTTSLLFGIAEALSNQFQLTSVSSFLILMIPYIAVILILVLQPERFKALKVTLDARRAARLAVRDAQHCSNSGGGANGSA